MHMYYVDMVQMQVVVLFPKRSESEYFYSLHFSCSIYSRDRCEIQMCLWPDWRDSGNL